MVGWKRWFHQLVWMGWCPSRLLMHLHVLSSLCIRKPRRWRAKIWLFVDPTCLSKQEMEKSSQNASQLCHMAHYGKTLRHPKNRSIQLIAMLSMCLKIVVVIFAASKHIVRNHFWKLLANPNTILNLTVSLESQWNVDCNDILSMWKCCQLFMHDSNTFLLKIRHWNQRANGDKTPLKSPVRFGHIDPI